MSDIKVEQPNTVEYTNRFGKKVSMPKESLIGAGIAGAIGAVGGAVFMNSFTPPKQLTQDEYVKQAVENAKNANAPQRALEMIKERAISEYPSYAKDVQNSIAEVKRLVPKFAGKCALGFAAAGSIIGGIVHLIKSSKAKNNDSLNSDGQEK